MRARNLLVAGLLLLALCGIIPGLRAAEIIPSAPARYFNDYALAVKPETAEALNRQLEDFEKTNGSQILVAIFPKMQSDAPIEDYTLRVARAWKVGGQVKNNGTVLFVFVQDRKMFVQVGYGLEGRLTDALSKDITADVIRPRFAAGDFDGGLTAGVGALIAAVKGEYQGSGRTVYQKSHSGGAQGGGFPVGLIFLLLIGFFLFISFLSRRQQAQRPRGGTFTGGGFSPIFLPTGGGWSSGGGSSSGGGFSGGGGDSGGFFEGGGGSFGGGGAGSDW